ncbi:MAG: uracil-DNA glycosylase [Balneolales bacterium]|nr:uracil-DNA glycosylase [Balneolales bacterium]
MSTKTEKEHEVIRKIRLFIDSQQEVFAPIGEITPSRAKELDEVSNKPDALAQNPADHTTKQNSLQESDTAKQQKRPHPSIQKDLMSLHPSQTCTTLEDLYKLCEQAEELKTELPNTKLVFGKGNPKADLVIVGEAPGAKEDEMGEPFVGASGNLLTKILSAIKIDRSQIYIANIVKHRPPENRTPTQQERNIGLPYLERQIELINPKLVLCLGLVSAQTLLNTKEALKDLRGRFHPYKPGIELTVTYHPAALLRNPNNKRPTWEDVQMLRKRYDELGCKPELPPFI